MKTLQLLLLKLFGLVVVVGGVLLIWYRFSELHALVLELVQRYPANPVLRTSVGVLSMVLGLVALLPARLSAGKDRKILVPSASGNNYIRLTPVENNLNKSLRKLPGVKRIAVTLFPTEGGRKVRVSADVTLRKGLTAGAREVVSRLNDQIMAHTKRELGADEVMSVELTIVGGLGISAPSTLDVAADSTPPENQLPSLQDESPNSLQNEPLPGFNDESTSEEDDADNDSSFFGNSLGQEKETDEESVE